MLLFVPTRQCCPSVGRSSWTWQMGNLLLQASPPNPAVNSDAPVYAFVLGERPGRRAGYLVR